VAFKERVHVNGEFMFLTAEKFATECKNSISLQHRYCLNSRARESNFCSLELVKKKKHLIVQQIFGATIATIKREILGDLRFSR
jgi:hypothetical protein